MFYPVAFNHVFHPSDFTEGDQGAVSHALKIALEARARLDLLHVEPHGVDIRWSDFPSVRATLERWGWVPEGSHRRDILDLGIDVKKVVREGGDVATKILDYIESEEPDLVVLATHQRSGPAAWVQGAMAARIARASRTVSLITPRRAPGFVSEETGAIQLRRVLVPIDSAPSPARALEALAALTRVLGVDSVEVSLFHVGEAPSVPDLQLPEVSGWKVDHTCWKGEVVDHILDVAESRGSDLIVMATHGRHGALDAWRGSVTERVIRGARCPILAVPA